MEVSELQDYVNADVHLDPEHDDLPLEHLFKVEEGVIESRVCRVNSAKVVVEILALWEHIQARDMLVARIPASQQKQACPIVEDPMAFKSRLKRDNLQEMMAQTNMFEEDIHKEYTLDS